MFNNKLIISTAVAGLLSVAGVASADFFDDTRFNVGGELSVLNKTDYKNANSGDITNFKTSNTADKVEIEKNKLGANIFVGSRFNENFGAELGYGFITKADADVQNSRKAENKINNIYVDALGFMPVTDEVELIGSIGAGRMKAKADVPGAAFTDKSKLTDAKIGVRVGAGAAYKFDDNWAVRGMVRYQKGNSDFLKSNTSLSLGAVYSF